MQVCLSSFCLNWNNGDNRNFKISKVVVFLSNRMIVGKIHIRPRNFANSEGIGTWIFRKLSINKVGMKSDQNFRQIMSEVKKLINKGIVINIAHEEGELISPIFLRSKPDWTNQVVLNLKDLN